MLDCGGEQVCTKAAAFGWVQGMRACLGSHILGSMLESDGSSGQTREKAELLYVGLRAILAMQG